MTLPILKRMLCGVCALLITWGASTTADAGFPNFYYSGYGPVSYTSYYGPGYGGYYGVGYRGYGLWGTNYVTSYYAPSYWGSSYCGSSCGSVCNPCGVSYGGCGVGCGSCGVSYGGCGVGCSTCGLASCYGCGFASTCCASDCDTGISTAPPASETQQKQDYDGGSSDQTFKDQNRGDQYEAPIQRNRSDQFDSNGEDLDSGGGGGIFPDGAGGAQIDRNTYKPLDGQNPPADAEPTVPKGSDDESQSTDDAADVPPADVPLQLAAGVAPTRVRVRYTVRFTVPRVARLEIAPRGHRKRVDAETKLAATE